MCFRTNATARATQPTSSIKASSSEQDRPPSTLGRYKSRRTQELREQAKARRGNKPLGPRRPPQAPTSTAQLRASGQLPATRPKPTAPTRTAAAPQAQHALSANAQNRCPKHFQYYCVALCDAICIGLVFFLFIASTEILAGYPLGRLLFFLRKILRDYPRG